MLKLWAKTAPAPSGYNSKIIVIRILKICTSLWTRQNTDQRDDQEWNCTHHYCNYYDFGIYNLPIPFAFTRDILMKLTF